MSVFTYEALNFDPINCEIRLLDILPGKGRIKCRVWHTSISARLRCEALSYCWGNSSDKVRIQLNGNGFLVTKNLHTALLRLRQPNQQRTLWIDAIYINQTDDEEKSRQVPLMRRIYQSCDRVLIWLGEQDEGTKLAYSFLELLAPWGRERKAAGVEARRYMELDEKLLERRMSAAHQRRYWGAIYSLFSRPWFQRVWVIQELAVCREAIMMCGTYSINWDEVEEAHYISERLFAESLERLISEHDHWKKQELEDLVHVVVRNLGAMATNPRDKVFALAGIALPGESSIDIDYTLDVDRIFETVTASCLKTRTDLDILSFAQGCRNDSSAVTPSWVLDSNYSIADDPMPVFSFAWGPALMEDGKVFRATLDSRSTITFKEDEKLLAVSGIVLDIITGVGSLMTNTQAGLPQLSWKYWSGLIDDFMCFSNWRDLCHVKDKTQDQEEYLHTNETMREAFWKTCCAVMPSLGEDETQIRLEFDYLDDFIATFRRFGTFRKKHIRTMYHPLLFAKLVKQALSNTQGTNLLAWSGRTDAATCRRMFKTKTGLIGLAPRFLQRGDSVALVKGAKVPLAIRPSGSRWRLVGECYVHGKMQGEAFDGNECGELWLE
jgi:hypothetical protein